MMTDPIADMLTRIRNASRIEAPAVDMPSAHLKERIAQVLKDEGFVLDFQVGAFQDSDDGRQVFVTPCDPQATKKTLRIFLKYGPDGERVIRHISRLSKPGQRIFRSYRDLKPVLDGLGISVLSTSRGVLSDRQAKTQRLGGEMICQVW